ncbi:MAG: histidine phosphatase family protein [Defluviitaleaceae bacterium]|nr:histidine phosphatase family protein [Defluviitaleaceae bacterium]
MTFYLIRHGQDDETIRGGWSNAGLNEEGKLQAIALSNYIGKNQDKLRIEKLFSSDLPRAAETAAPISSALNLEIGFLPEFRETNNGLLAGMPNAVAEEKYPGLFWSALEWDEPYPHGESPRTFYERIKTAWDQFSAAILAESKNVALITHSGVINVIYTLIEGTNFSNKARNNKIAHATLIPIEYDNKWRRK